RCLCAREKKNTPLGACIPLLLQLPVFISLFYMLRTDLKKRICGPSLVEHFNALQGTHLHVVNQLPAKYVESTGCQQVDPGSAKFLFIPDITAKATGVALAILLVLYVGSQVFPPRGAPAPAAPTHPRLMLLLPLVFVVILYRYPAGLLVYW